MEHFSTTVYDFMYMLQNGHWGPAIITFLSVSLLLNCIAYFDMFLSVEAILSIYFHCDN